MGSTPTLGTTSLKLRGAEHPRTACPKHQDEVVVRSLGEVGPMFYVYILQLSNNDVYVGRTDDLKRRIKEHRLSQQRTTRNCLPCKLISYIAFDTKEKSILFEKYLKTGSGFAFRRRHFTFNSKLS